MGYNTSETKIIYFTNVAACSLSILGSLFIIILFFKFKSLRDLPFRLVFYMVIADLLHSVGLILPFFVNDTLCQLQGYLISYFSLSTILWSAFIAHAISITIIEQESIAKYEKYYLIFGFIVPLLCFLSNIYKPYEVALGWCWIYQSTDHHSYKFYVDILLRFTTYYIPLWIILCYNTYKYFHTIKYIKTSNIGIANVHFKDLLILKMRVYPVILVLCQFPITIIRVVNFFIIPPWWAFLIAGAATSINGFCNAIAYGLTNQVKDCIKKLLMRKYNPLASQTFSLKFS